MNMDESSFDNYANWLHPEQTHYLNHRVELELVKGACWRLTYEHVSSKDEFALLALALNEIAEGYTNARFLLQKNFSAIAVNAIVAVFVLEAMCQQSELSSNLWNLVLAAERNWFTQLVQHRLKNAVAAIAEHDAELSELLQHLATTVCVSGKDD